MADDDHGTVFRYSVFISYSRKDIDFARRLEDALESYRPPRHLPVPRRPLRVFRDESDFTGGEYSAALDRNLRDASKLLVICSPNSRASKAVNQEIERFSAYRGTENIIPVLLAGVPNNNAKPDQEEQKSFPEALMQRLSMPLAADYRGIDAQRDRPDARRYEHAWYKLLADVYADYRVTRDQVAGAEVRRNAQRRKALIAGTATVVLGLSVLTGWALVERRDAVRQREEVEAKKRLLEAAIEKVTYEFPNELRALKPAPAVLEATYYNNYQLLKDLFEKGVTGPMLDLPMAINVLNLADIWVQQGRLGDAARYLDMIPERHGLMPTAERSDPAWQDRLSLAYDFIAVVAIRQGDTARAEEQYRAALAIRSEQAAKSPQNLRWKMLLASSQQQLCTFDLGQARLERARQQCTTALEAYRRLADEKETSAEARAGQIWTRMYLADLAEEQGRLPETLEQLTAAALLAERDRAELQLESVALHERRGRALAAMHDFRGAIAEANEALRLGEELGRHQEDADAQHNLAILRHDIATIYRDSGRPADALREFSAACAVVESLLQKDADNVEWRRLFAECLGDVGEMRLLTADPQSALADLLRALAIHQDLAATGGEQPGWQRGLATCQRQVGDWYARRGAHGVALEKYRQAQQLLERLKPRAAGSRKLDEELAEIHARIGAVQRAARDRAAIDSYGQAVAGYRALAAHDPSNARWQKALAEATTALAALQRSGGPEPAARPGQS